MKHYIGLDAHSKTCTFVVITTRGDEIISQRIRTGEREIKKFVRSIEGEKSLTFEESHMAKWLYTALSNEVDELLVCNPLFIAKRPGPKDDYHDARQLAQQLRGGYLTSVYHDDNFFSQLRSVVGSYEDVVQDLTRLKNRYKALFRTPPPQRCVSGVLSLF